MLDALRQQGIQGEGREAEPSAGVIDSHSVKAADTLGLLITLITVTVCAAGVQDRDDAKGALPGLYLTSPTCR
ncbi:hypothetical protein [Actinomadura chokoriensis]|uniref:Transposase family protein n=1 Tax=Actinomadura chokoriensis TaxID=454156 RepID=A0ABV4QWJ1_9ACTN